MLNILSKLFLNSLITIVSELMRPLQTTKQNENRHFDEFHWPGRDYSWISFNKILIIGLGQLGLPVAKYVKTEVSMCMDMILVKAIERAEKADS